MTILMVKLINGDDIIGDFTILNTKEMQDAGVAPAALSVKAPALLAMVPGPDGKPQLGMADYLPFAKAGVDGKKRINIGFDKILYEFEPTEAIYNAYNTQFGSGIVKASSLLHAAR